jgi:hypothetical protein
MIKNGERREGPTPNGGAYSILYIHDDGQVEIVEFSVTDQEIRRTYYAGSSRSVRT